MSEAAPEPASGRRSPVLEAVGLTKDYGKRRVVDGLDLTVRAGDVYGFLGPNGAGKSTTIRMLLGLIRPTGGEARLMGLDLRRQRTQALGQVGAQVEAPAFYGYLSGYRNLQLLASLSRPTTRDEILAVLARVRLAGRERDKVKTYSQGMKMRLGLAQALLAKPQLLILDEPTNGLDPQGMKEVRELIVGLARDEGITVFISSHLLSEIQHVCNRVAVIDQGRLVVEGAVSELLDSRSAGRVEVVCDRPAEAAEVARGLAGVAEVQVDGRALEVVIDADRAADLNAALVQAGFRVSELMPARMTLEEFFLAVTGGSR